MALDPSIALGIKPVQIESPLNQMAKMYEMQNIVQSNKLNQMKMDEYTRGVAEDEAVRNYFAQQDRTSPDFVKGLYGVSPKIGQAYEKAQLEALKEKAAIGETESKTKTADFERKSKQLNIMGQAFGFVRTSPTPQAATRALSYLVTNGVIDKAQADEQLALIAADPSPANIKALADQGFIAVLAAKDQLPKFESQQNVMVNGVPTTRVLQLSPLGERATTVEGSQGATYNKPAASTVVNVDNKQESEFNKQVGKDQAEILKTSKAGAEDAAQILATNMVGKTLLDKGMLTGVGANFFTTLNQGLSQAGIDFGYADAAQNSQAYGALMAANTAKIIKQFGAGTGLSDADREYALKAAAGDIKMDEKAIRKILTINNRAAQNAITKHNKMVKTVEDKTKTILPYSVEVTDYTAGIPEGRASAAKKGAKTLDDIFK
jgi:hypothetical protein